MRSRAFWSACFVSDANDVLLSADKDEDDGATEWETRVENESMMDANSAWTSGRERESQSEDEDEDEVAGVRVGEGGGEGLSGWMGEWWG